MIQEINFREVVQLRFLADALELRHVNGVPCAVVPIPLTLADDKVQRYVVTGSKAEIAMLLEIEPAHDKAPTDLSKRLRDAATADVAYPMARLLIGAAEEIERYYGGMLNWKRTAEAKGAGAQAAAAEVRDSTLEEAAIFFDANPHAEEFRTNIADAIRALKSSAGGTGEQGAVRAVPLTRCAAGRDGECGNAQCPQLRDNEPATSGRHCPLDNNPEEC